jgi:hypothetical protein
MPFIRRLNSECFKTELQVLGRSSSGAWDIPDLWPICFHRARDIAVPPHGLCVDNLLQWLLIFTLL